MKQKLVITAQVLLILGLLPFFMGQQDCEADKVIQDLFDQKIMKQGPGGSTQDTYVSHLSFMDAQTKSTMVQTEVAGLINEAVVDGMSRASKVNPKLKNNEAGHIIKDNDLHVNKLVNFFFDPVLTADDKVSGIIREMMDPNNVDVIVGGQYIDEAKKPEITVRPFIIVKDGRKLMTRNLQFSREALLCEDPNNPGKKVLCKSSHDEIAQAVKELLENM